MARSSSGDLDGRLNDVERALAEGRPRSALLGLLGLWPELRSVAIAEAVELLSAKLTRGRGPVPQGKSQKTNLEAFMVVAAAQDPADIGRLRDDFCAAFHGSSQVVLSPRADALSVFAADPRLGLPLGALLAQPIYFLLRGNAGKKLWTRLFAVLLASEDPRLVPFLREVGPTLAGDSPAITAWLCGKAEKVAAALEKLHVDNERRHQLDAIRHAIDTLDDAVDEAAAAATPAAAEAPLLEQALANPADDQARMVLADLWQQRGDPRGELVALQLARQAGRWTKKAERREAALIKANLDTWLGALAKAIQPGGVSFEGGFPVAVTLRKTAARAVGTLRDLDAWRSVHTICFHNRSFFSPKMTALRHAHQVCAAGLDELSAHARAPMLETLTLGDYITVEQVDAARFPALRHLGFGAISNQPHEALARSPLAAQLDTLIMASAPDVGTWLSSLSKFPLISLQFVSAPWAPRRVGSGWFVTVTPVNDWSRVRLALSYRGAANVAYTQELPRLLEGLVTIATKIEHIDFALPPPTVMSREIRGHVARLLDVGATLPADWNWDAGS